MELQTSSLNQYKESVVKVFVESFDNLQSVLCGSSLKDFNGKIYAAGLIGFSAMDKDVKTVHGLLITGINMCYSVSEIKVKYKQFIDSLKAIGGPARTLGEKIENQLQLLKVHV